MAVASQDPKSTILTALTTPFVVVWDYLVALSENSEISREAQRLFDMSDAELAKLGLRREEIAQHLVSKFATV